MRVTLDVVGVLLLVIGVIWILQGINVLPGSFMTGRYSGPSMAGWPSWPASARFT